MIAEHAQRFQSLNSSRSLDGDVVRINRPVIERRRRCDDFHDDTRDVKMFTESARGGGSRSDKWISGDDSAGGGTRHLESAPNLHFDRICSDSRLAQRDPDSEEPRLYTTDDGSSENWGQRDRHSPRTRAAAVTLVRVVPSRRRRARDSRVEITCPEFASLSS